MNVSFLKIILCYYFSSEAALQGVAKNNSTEEQIDAESQAKLSMRQRGVKTHRMENVKFIVAICKDCLHPNVRSSHLQVFYEKVFLKISQNLQKSTCFRASFLIKTSGNFIKIEASAAFSYEFCEIFKNTFFMEHHRWLLFKYVFIWIIFCYF